MHCICEKQHCIGKKQHCFSLIMCCFLLEQLCITCNWLWRALICTCSSSLVRFHASGRELHGRTKRLAQDGPSVLKEFSRTSQYSQCDGDRVAGIGSGYTKWITTRVYALLKLVFESARFFVGGVSAL